MSQRGVIRSGEGSGFDAITIESLEFARRRESVSGCLRPEALPRVMEALFDASGRLDCTVSGETVAGKAFLAVKIGGSLSLACQRCLGPLAFALDVRRRIMLIEPGMPWPEDDQPGGLEDETCDAIEASRELDLVSLLEDEILLALPVAPRHTQCAPPVAEALPQEKASPFAQLARLKRS